MRVNWFLLSLAALRSVAWSWPASITAKAVLQRRVNVMPKEFKRRDSTCNFMSALSVFSGALPDSYKSFLESSTNIFALESMLFSGSQAGTPDWYLAIPTDAINCLMSGTAVITPIVDSTPAAATSSPGAAIASGTPINTSPAAKTTVSPQDATTPGSVPTSLLATGSQAEASTTILAAGTTVRQTIEVTTVPSLTTIVISSSTSIRTTNVVSFYTTAAILSTGLPTSVPTSGAPSSLPTGAKIGIGVGAPVVAVCIIGLASFFIISRRRKAQQGSAKRSPVNPSLFDPGTGAGMTQHSSYPHLPVAPPRLEHMAEPVGTPAARSPYQKPLPADVQKHHPTPTEPTWPLPNTNELPGYSATDPQDVLIHPQDTTELPGVAPAPMPQAGTTELPVVNPAPVPPPNTAEMPGSTDYPNELPAWHSPPGYPGGQSFQGGQPYPGFYPMT